MTSSFQPAGLGQIFQTNYGADSQQAIQDLATQSTAMDAMAKQNEQAAIENASQLNDSNAQAFNALSSFSKSIQSVVSDVKKRERENEIAEAKALVLEGKLTKDDITQYYEDERQLRAQKNRVDKAAGDAALNGAPYEATSRLRKLNAWQRHAAVQMITKQLAGEYESDIENAFNSDNTTKYPLPDGTTLTPVQARQGTRSQQLAMRAILRNEYLKKTGLIGVADEILVDQAQETMAAADRKVDSANARLYALNDSEEQIEAAKNNFFVTKDPNDFLLRTVGLMTANGVMTRGMALDELDRLLVNATSAGPNGEPAMISKAEYEALKAVPIQGGKPGETWGSKHKLRFRSIETLQAKAERQAFNDKEQARQQRADKFQLDVLAQLGNNPTEASIDLALESFRNNPDFNGFTPTILLYERANFSAQAVARKEMDKTLKRLADANQLTSATLAQYPLDMRQKYAEAAKAGDSFMRPELKGYDKIIESYLKKATNTLPGGTMPDTALILQPMMVQQFQKRVLELEALGTPNAANQAWAEIRAEAEAGRDKPESIYYKTAKGYENVLPKLTAVSATNKNANEELKKLEHKIKGGVAGLSTYEYRSKEHLEKRELNYGKPGWEHDPLFVYLGSRFNVNPLTIENLQRRKHGLKELTVPESLQTIQNNVKPGFQQFLNRYQSENRTTRALSTMGWQPTIVPNNMGEHVQQVAQQNNVEPSLLAAVAEKNGMWDKEAIQALGGQLGVLREQNGGSINAALAALSGFPNADDPDFKSTYLTPVLKSAVKYGGQSVLRGADLMRPGMYDKVQAVTGNSGISTGPHADLRVWSKSQGRYIDPTSILDQYVFYQGKPIGKAFPVTSKFGPRKAPTAGASTNHQGVDYGTPMGTGLDIRGKYLGTDRNTGAGGNIMRYALTDDLELRVLHT
jgi:hypothetical protein